MNKNIKICLLSIALAFLHYTATQALDNIHYSATSKIPSGSNVTSEYAISCGNGASIDATLPVELILPKKIALAIITPDGGFTNNSLFTTYTPPQSSVLQINYDGVEDGALPNHSLNKLLIEGAIYTNTDNTIVYVDNSSPEFIHEDGINSGSIQTFCEFKTFEDGTLTNQEDCYNDVIISFANLINTDGVARLQILHHIYIPSVNPTDRPGTYINTTTVTVTSP